MVHAHMLLLAITLSVVAVRSTVVEDILGLNKKNNELPKGPARLIGGGSFRNQIKRQRPALSAPPYAVQMEPVFKYSQRDPLYEQKVKNITNVESTSISSKADHDVESSNQVIHKVIHYKPPPIINPPSHPYPYYVEPPEPIIEIIIKESNISLPAPTTTPPPPTTKEPIHVFYVKYKKNPHPSEHGDDIIYEEPVPALTPHATEIVEGGEEEEPNYGPTYAEPLPSPPPSTTLRTIIRPESETYHGSGLKITFGSPAHEEHHGEEEYGQSAPQPQVTLPEKKHDTEVETSTEASKHHYSKRQQGPFHEKQIRHDQPAFVPQADSQQYRPLVPSPQPTHTSDHRFPGQALAHFHQGDSRLVQQPSHLTVPQPTDGFQNGPFHGRLPQNIRPNWQSQQKPEQGPFSTRQPQYTDRTFLVPHQQHPPNVPSLRIQPPSPPTQFQIQEYQRHKEFLHQQSLKQQHNQQVVLPTPQQIPNTGNRFQNSEQPLEQQHIQSITNRYPNNQQVEPQQIPAIGNRFTNNQKITPTPLSQNTENRFQNNHKSVDSQASLVPSNRLTNNQQASHQVKTPLNIHVEQSPIIDQSQLSQHLSPQLQLFNQGPTTQNSLPQQYPIDGKNYNDGTNYGFRLRGKTPQGNIRNLQDQHLTKQHSFVQREEINYNPEFSKQPDASLRNENRNVDKYPDSEIIKSISSLEEHQIQPGYKDAKTDQIIPSTPSPTLSFNNKQSGLQPARNHQQYNFPLSNQPRPTESRYTVRTQSQLNADRNYNPPPQTDIVNYSIQNNPSSTVAPTLNNQSEGRYTDRNKYLTVYSRPANKTPQNNRKTYSSTTSRPEYRISPSVTSRTEAPKTEQTTESKDHSKEEEKRKMANIAALPSEVPDDLREQLLSSGILGNADIQILDYDKVGDIPIESLPPEALENFYGAASAPVPSIVKPNDYKKTVDMRVVRYDPKTDLDQDFSNKYFKENASKIDPVVLNDSKYKRYLPLKVSGSQFPIPDVPQLKDRIVNSVVVLAPVDYDFIKSQEDEGDHRRGRVIQIQGVKFIVGDSLMTVIKEPTHDNYKRWLQNELSVPAQHQSVILLVTRGKEAEDKAEIYMYEAGSGKVTKLRGELSSAFVEVADSNSQSQDLEGLSVL